MSVKKLSIGFATDISNAASIVTTTLADIGTSYKYNFGRGAQTINMTDLWHEQGELNKWLVWLKVEPLLSDIEPVPLFLNLDSFHSHSWIKSDVWLYQDGVYSVTGNYTDAERKLLILDSADSERQRFERLALKFSKEQNEHVKYERTRISENVRIEVWRRDQGRCASCSSRENLEYDHIVPVSRGGSNTARNVELLARDATEARATGYSRARGAILT